MLPNLSIPDRSFPVTVPTLIRSRFLAKPENFLIPNDVFTSSLVEEFYGAQYENDSISLTNVGSGNHCSRNFPPCVYAYCHSSWFSTVISEVSARKQGIELWAGAVFLHWMVEISFQPYVLGSQQVPAYTLQTPLPSQPPDIIGKAGALSLHVGKREKGRRWR